MKTKAYKIFSLLFFVTIFTVSCQKSNTNDLQIAQICLNAASAGSALSCVNKISGDTSENAFKLRCAAYFISEGFGAMSSFAPALDQINGSTTGCSGTCSPTLAAMTTLSFRSGNVSLQTVKDANNLKAATTFEQCSQSGVKIYSEISSIFRIGTLTAMIAGVSNPSATQLEAALPSLPSATLGAVVLTAYQTSCTNLDGASDSAKKYCSELNSAIGTKTDPTLIGDCMKIKLDNPAALCP